MDPTRRALREAFFPDLFGREEADNNMILLLGHSVKHDGLDIPDPRVS